MTLGCDLRGAKITYNHSQLNTIQGINILVLTWPCMNGSAIKFAK